MIPIVFVVSALVLSIWPMAGVAILVARRDSVEPSRLVRWCWAELRPFYLPANAAFAIADYLINPASIAASAMSVALGLLLWRYTKDIDDDDRWKRRKAKLADMVARKGARLVVVPVSAGAR